MKQKRLNFQTIFLIGIVLSLLNCSKNKADPQPQTPADSGKAKVWLTKGDKSVLLSRGADLLIHSQPTSGLPVITIDTVMHYQTIEGFGAALTGSSAYLINRKLSTGARQTLLLKLFDTVNGAGISFLRLTIGASDFSLSDFTYDDMPAGQTDFPLDHFSLAQDTLDVIPILKEIAQISPSVALLGSPWSPPAWMKTNGSLKGGALKTNCYAVYAYYFVRYIEQMKALGITISAITPQNEPLYSTANYPCMSMGATEQADFIKISLGPIFNAAGIQSKIIIYDHNWDNTAYAISILNDAAAKTYVSGSAFHAYAGDVLAMSTVHNVYPDKGLYFTEISGGAWASDFSGNLMWNMKNIFIGTMQNWSKCALLWNLALDQNYGPTNNGCSNCRGVVTINSSSSQVSFNEEYYSIAHFSKFVRPGAIRVGLSLPAGLTEVGAVAFTNPDGTKTMVICNYGSNSKSFSVSQGKHNFDYTIPALSVVSMVW
ncbi:MAG: glycoside hydrolase family 30 beta sandwich domain-containing protein [Bacteroidota bacterium]